jgi:hypothetical protein
MTSNETSKTADTTQFTLEKQISATNRCQVPLIFLVFIIYLQCLNASKGKLFLERLRIEKKQLMTQHKCWRNLLLLKEMALRHEACT